MHTIKVGLDTQCESPFFSQVFWRRFCWCSWYSPRLYVAYYVVNEYIYFKLNAFTFSCVSMSTCIYVFVYPCMCVNKYASGVWMCISTLINMIYWIWCVWFAYVTFYVHFQNTFHFIRWLFIAVLFVMWLKSFFVLPFVKGVCINSLFCVHFTVPHIYSCALLNWIELNKPNTFHIQLWIVKHDEKRTKKIVAAAVGANDDDDGNDFGNGEWGEISIFLKIRK